MSGVPRVEKVVSFMKAQNNRRPKQEHTKKRKGKRPPFDPGPGGIA